MIDHRDSLGGMLEGRVESVHCVADSNTWLAQNARAPGWLGRIQRMFDRMTRTRHRGYLAQLLQAIDRDRLDLVIGYWGTEPLSDLVAIRRLRPHVKLVLMVLCYPVGLTAASVRRQCWMMRRAGAAADGIMFPNAAMQRYFSDRVLGPGMPRSAVIPPCWPERFQSSQPGAPVGCATAPAVIFTGRTDLSHHTIHPGDDLRPLMQSLLDAGIELHHVHSKETDDGHPRRRVFQPLKQADLIVKMSGYDASLIAYNTDACQRDERFHLTVPDRLISSVAAGVPIAIPKRGYEGAKQYLADHGAVFEFEDAADLRRQLSDRSHVQAYRDRAWEVRSRYTAQAQAPLLAALLTDLL